MRKKIFSVVIIDDEPYNIERMEEFVAAHDSLSMLAGFSDPISARNWILAEGQPIDFAFIDVEMPGMKGHELLSQVRHLVRFAVFTTGAFPRQIPGFDPARDFYLPKPFDHKMFMSVISSALLRRKNGTD